MSNSNSNLNSNININIIDNIDNIDYYKYNSSLNIFLDTLHNQLNNPVYLYLNEELTKYISYEPELTYCDLLVYKIINHPKYYTKSYNKSSQNKSYNVYQNFEKMYTIITKFLYNTPEKINQLIQHIENLNLDTFEKIMSDTRAQEIDINNLYSHKNLEISLGYLLIFSSKLTTEQNEQKVLDVIWKLLQYSIIYANKLKEYIKNQIQYFKILHNYFKCYEKIYKTLFKYIVDLESFNYKINLYLKHKNIFDYLNPSDVDEWRIYYNFYLLNKYYNKKFTMYNYKIIPLEFNKSYYINELCILSLYNFYYYFYDNKYTNLKTNTTNTTNTPNIETIKSIIFNKQSFKLLFWIPSHNLLDDIDYIIQYKFQIISSINYIFYKIDCIYFKSLSDEFDDKDEDENNFTMDSWKNRYFNMTIDLISYLKITNARIYENYDKIYKLLKNNNNDIKITYSDLGNLAIDLNNYKKIFFELPKIFDIIIKKKPRF
jgi:hypothetical protein